VRVSRPTWPPPPIVAVILGAALLHEKVPSSPAYLAGYVGCVFAIVLGAIQLADDARPDPEADDGRPEPIPLVDQPGAGQPE